MSKYTPSLGRKTGFSSKTKKGNKTKKTKHAQNKEGLGPSEVALRVTSPGPSTLQKQQKQPKQKFKKNKN